MRILVVSQYFYPENFRINDMVQEMTNRGHQVTVLTGLPNYPEGIVPEEYRHNKRKEEELFGARVLRSRMRGRKQGAINLGINYLTFAVCAAWKALWNFHRKEFDVILNFQPSPVFSTFPAWIASKKTGAPIFLYCMDLWPEAMKVFGLREGSLPMKMVGVVSRWLYRRCSRIAVTSPDFVEYLTGYHRLDAESVLYLPQYAEDMELKTEPQMQKPEEMVFMFCGNMGSAQYLEVIVEAARRLEVQKIDGYQVHFVGDGSAAADIRKMVDGYGLIDRFVFHGLQPQDQMGRFYQLADVLLITLKSDTDSLIGRTIPGKFQTYLAVGKPILGAIGSPVKELIREAGCGYAVDSDDASSLAEKMQLCLDERRENPEHIKSMGENARKYFENNFSKELFFERLECVFDEMI